MIRCIGYKESDNKGCASCYRRNFYTYVKCQQLTQERIEREKGLNQVSEISLVLFDKNNNVLKDKKLTYKQLKQIENIIK